MSEVVNLDTTFWTPAQVARWLTTEAEAGRVQTVLVLVERHDDNRAEHTEFEWCLSKVTHESLWYMVSWLWRRLNDKYFGPSNDTMSGVNR
jgi:hypothetical protein